jgi:hypothetical protein
MEDFATINTQFPVGKKVLAKERAKLKILEYLGNPENEFPTRTDLALKVCGFKDKHYLYRVFTPAELAQLEREGLEIRRSKYARFMAFMDHVLLRQANKGDVAAIKLAYQKFEGWLEGSKVIYPDKDGNPQPIASDTKIINISEAKLREVLEDLNRRV